MIAYAYLLYLQDEIIYISNSCGIFQYANGGPLNPVEYEVRGHGQQAQNTAVCFQIHSPHRATLKKERVRENFIHL